MPILFRWALRPQCPVRRRKIVVCWAHTPVSKLGQGTLLSNMSLFCFCCQQSNILVFPTNLTIVSLSCTQNLTVQKKRRQSLVCYKKSYQIIILIYLHLPCYKHYLRVSYQLNYCFIAIHTPTELFRKSTESCLAQEIMPNNNILQYHVIYTHSTDYLHKELRFHEQTKGNTYQTWPHRFPCSVICCNAKLPLFLFKICFFWPNKQPPPPKKTKMPK